MKVSRSKRFNEICSPYISEISEKCKTDSSLPDEMRKLAQKFVKSLHIDASSQDTIEAFKEYADSHGIINIDSMADGEFGRLIDFLLGEETGDIVKNYIRSMPRQAYTERWNRRSQRTRMVKPHISNLYYLLITTFLYHASKRTPSDILSVGRTPEEVKEFEEASFLNQDLWLAAMIMSGNRECIAWLSEAMTAETNFKKMTYEHFRAIARSGNYELLELEGKLLMAARLQEGLRQAIVETMDCGLPESFIHIFNVIRDNNLQRFASVKRGVAVTTGLGEQDAPDRITDKFINLIHSYINSRDEARKGIESDNAMEVFLGLWATGFVEVLDTVPLIEKLIAEAPAYKVEAAMLYLECTQLYSINSRLASLAIHTRYADHAVVAGALEYYLPEESYTHGGFMHSWNMRNAGKITVPPLSDYFNSKEETEVDFELMVSIFNDMKPKEVFDPYVFPWIQVTLTRDEIATRICRLAMLIGTPEQTDRAIDFMDAMDPSNRSAYLNGMMMKPATRKQVRFLVDSMSDRSEAVREIAIGIVKKINRKGLLIEEDYATMRENLRLKAADMRIATIGILADLPEKEAQHNARLLLNDKSADRRLAALDMIRIWQDKGKHTALVESLLPDVKGIARPTSREKVLIDAICNAEDESESGNSAANGYGLYDPEGEISFDIAAIDTNPDIRNILWFADKKRYTEVLGKIMEMIRDNADLEFKNEYGETQRFGNTVYVSNYNKTGLKSIAFPEKWEELYRREIADAADMLRLKTAREFTDSKDKAHVPVLSKYFGDKITENLFKGKGSDDPMYNSAVRSIDTLYEEYGRDDEGNLRNLIAIVSHIAATIAPKDAVKRYKRFSWSDKENIPVYSADPLSTIINQLRDSDKMPGELFRQSFVARYTLWKKAGYESETTIPVRAAEYLRAWHLGIISESDVRRELLARGQASADLMEILSEMIPGAKLRASWRWRKGDEPTELTAEEVQLIAPAIDAVLDIELQRGDTPTPVSEIAENIRCIRGVDYLMRILTGLGKEKPVVIGYNAGNGKRTMFSRLLGVCIPGEEDNAKRLRQAAAKAGISDEQLVVAAMYSHRWLGIVEEAIGWKGLTSAAYYFMAHTGESLDESAKSHISRYTVVSPDDFADGAFDPVWFREVYKVLGKKRFEVVYGAARYIAEGNRHTRARKLSDAALGILKAKDVQKEIVEKRNKDLVVAYGLIPLSRNRLKDLRQRYALLSKFAKESKQFGAQRQASEGRAVKLALDNLARTAGFGDSVRLTWCMEADLVKEVSEFLAPAEIDGVRLWIELESGVPELVVESKGKRLQSIPTRLKKDKYVEKMREVYKQLKDQHTRGRALLETAMTDGAEFTAEEIGQLRENPVIWSLLSRLVLRKADGFGFPGDDGKSLVSSDGEILPIDEADILTIAHPYDLMESGVWSSYQSALFERQMRQPFKQVFRELYIPVEEEKEQSKSLRYAGNQILPARTVGVLKKRQWTVDYENGLQKVCFNGNVTAVMYAMADWFSPADIEPPTLEYVAFYDRRTLDDKNIGEVDPKVFSEIMRDVDLVVSVAHAGGVDPETSHSTIEMRRAIVEHSLPMFGIENVELTGNFAKVKGTHACYNIHLGSGVIHKEGGAHIAVLPVHSQTRGRIFMPFLDEDPKTAEIISKILLFADDTKIKDPFILNQI